MKLKILSIFFLIFSFLVLCQTSDRLEVVTDEGTYNIPVYNRQGTIYFSVNHFAEVLNINYRYDLQADKIELVFPQKKLIITAKNPFILVTSSDYRQKDIYQLPTTTYSFNNNIFIPVRYSLHIIKLVFEKDLIYSDAGRVIIKNIEEYAERKDEVPSEFGIYGIELDEKANGTLIRLKSNQKISTYSSSFKEGVLTISFKDVHTDVSKINGISGEGLIKSISVKNNGPNSDFHFNLNKEYTTSEVISAAGSNDILITLHNKIFVRDEDKIKEKWNFDIIVLDAGHGGHDAGTIGVNGVKEKDINLAITLKVGELLEKNMKDIKVVYTRKNDTFVELYKRGKIANESGGKLFISIHCNATLKKPSSANGFEVYLLRPGRTKEAIEIAERENSVIQYEENPERYEKLTDENFILVTMAHSSYMKYSEKFSDLLNKEIIKDSEIVSRGVKQAGFYVLVGAAMPSVLIEAGFLSNKENAAYLKSNKGQNNIADAIFNAIKEFKNEYQKSMEYEL